jgi:ribosomal protein S27E
MVHYDFDATLERMVEWANSLNVSKREAFKRIAKLMKKDHFGIEHIELDNYSDLASSYDEGPTAEYLNTGDTYSTTLVLTDDYVNGVKLIITTWGDWYEEQERWVYEHFSAVRCSYCGHFHVMGEDRSTHDTKCDRCGHHLDGSN